MMPVLAGAVEDCARGDGFGRGLAVNSFLESIGRRERRAARELDHYVEAQIHGPVVLSRDVAAVHLDPSFVDTNVHRDLRSAAQRYGFELSWTEGSEVRPASIDTRFRGPEAVALATRTTRGDGFVDAAAIGRALSGVPYTPPSIEGDAEDSSRQRYKRLWHCCLRFGAPPRGVPRS